MNPIKEVGHGIAVAGKATGHAIAHTGEAVAHVITFTEKAVKVLETAIKAEPEVKEVVKELTVKSQAIGMLVSEDIAVRGLDPVADIQTLLAIKDMAEYVTVTVIPLIERLYGDVKVDVTK